MTTSTTTLSIPDLRAALAGRVVTADDPDYDDVRRVWPGNIDGRPGLIVRVANADEVMFATGFTPGAVAPFPLRAVARVLIDPALLQHEVVWIGAGSDEHLASIAPGELQRLTKATPVELVRRG